MDIEHLRRAARLGEGTALRPERFGALAYDFDTRRLSFVRRRSQARGALNEEFEQGLDAPICLTWELTYACNLACVHCLSSSGRRDPRELSTAECKAVIDELERMQVFYVNIGGGEPTVRKDFWELVEYATAHKVGVKFSTNGSRIDAERARVAGGERLRRRADLARRRDGRGQRPRPRPGLLRHRDRRDAPPARGGDAGLQALGGGDARERRPSSTRSRRSPTPTARSCGSRACGRRAAARTSGTSCTRRRASSASSTTGWRRAGRRC